LEKVSRLIEKSTNSAGKDEIIGLMKETVATYTLKTEVTRSDKVLAERATRGDKLFSA
jgi:hypothetical protein